MSRAGILLRVLLSVSLVLNSIGASSAATAMMAFDASTPKASVVEVVPPVPRSICHDHALVTHEQKAPETDPASKTPDAPADCCGGGLCGCACVQLSSLAAIELLFVPPNLDHEHLSDAMAPTRPSPALPHLIRPPIA